MSFELHRTNFGIFIGNLKPLKRLYAWAVTFHDRAVVARSQVTSADAFSELRTRQIRRPVAAAHLCFG